MVAARIATTSSASDGEAVLGWAPKRGQVKLKRLAEGITVLAGQAGGKFDEFVRRYTFSSWWLSIDQFTFLCEHTRDLRKATAPTGGTTFGTGDLMNEIAHYDRMGMLKPKA
jgi:hypothetical protein